MFCPQLDMGSVPAPQHTLAQAAQKLVGRWADNQVTSFCTKCYRTKDRSNWLCGGDKE